MAKTEVILTSNIVGLGAESDQVKVSAGYARNYLLPRGLAILLTGANKRRLEVLRQRRAEREAHEFNTMNELAKSLSKLIAVVTVKTGEDGKMFGSVTAGTIADQIKTQFDVNLDKRKIHLEHPIRSLGEHEVELRLHADVVTTMKVKVETSTPPPAVEAPPAQTADAAPRRERRGHRGDIYAPTTAELKARAAKAEEGKVARPEKGTKPERAAKTERSAKTDKSA
jgi:large subunit ribosomal protein L9